MTMAATATQRRLSTTVSARLVAEGKLLGHRGRVGLSVRARRLATQIARADRHGDRLVGCAERDRGRHRGALASTRDTVPATGFATHTSWSSAASADALAPTSAVPFTVFVAGSIWIRRHCR